MPVGCTGSVVKSPGDRPTYYWVVDQSAIVHSKPVLQRELIGHKEGVAVSLHKDHTGTEDTTASKEDAVPRGKTRS